MYKRLIFALLCTLFFAGIVSADNRETPTKPVGTNLPLFTDWNYHMTIDAFKQSRAWITSNWSTWDTYEREQLALILDENGYPTQLPASDDQDVLYRHVTTLIFTDLPGEYPMGEYTVLYDGEGLLSYGRDAELSFSEPGRDIINVTPSTGIVLRIIETNPENHLRNIRVIMPGYTAEQAETQIFHDDFLNSLAAYDSIRFMDWQRINWDSDGPIERSQSGLDVFTPAKARTVYKGPVSSPDWVDRPLTTDARYTSDKGVPVETMIELANMLDSDAWFNMPHMADDAYIMSFAELAHSQLEDERSVYVEYSNEIWNYGFAQGMWIEEQAKLDASIGEGSNLQKRLSWYGKRSTEICDIWKTMWGVDSDRIICTIATQAANPWVGEQMIDCPLWSGSPCHVNVDSVAIAPYFGQHIGHPAYYDEVQAWTNASDNGLNSLFQELEFGSVLSDRADNYVYKTTLSNMIDSIYTYSSIADMRGIDLVSYEGGQHLVGLSSVQNDPNIQELFQDANRDPRMGMLYCQYLAAWHDAGGKLFTHYLAVSPYTNWGAWGAAESYYATNAPKRDALNSYALTGECAPVNTAEPNDLCETAPEISADGTTQTWAFHKPNDVNWVKFEGIANHDYEVRTDVPPNSPADLSIEIHESCENAPTARQAVTFSTRNQLTFQIPADGTYYIRLVNEKSAVFGYNVTYDLSVQDLHEIMELGAVVLIGGRGNTNDIVQPDIHYVMHDAFDYFSSLGYEPDDIHYIASEAETAPIRDMPALEQNVGYTIVDWAKERVSAQKPLTIYMMSHGDPDVYHLDSEYEYEITPAELNGWLTTLEEAITTRDGAPPPINLIIEACHSGSFIESADLLSKPNRVIITSTGSENLAYAIGSPNGSQRGAMFSNSFLDTLRTGGSLWRAYRTADWFVQDKTNSFASGKQTPWLDDDGITAMQRTFGAGIAHRGDHALWEPHIAAVAPIEPVTGEVTLQVDVFDDKGVDEVWAVLYPPSYSPAISQTGFIVDELPTIQLKASRGGVLTTGVAYTGVFPQLEEVGTYRAVIYAVDDDGLLALPQTVSITNVTVPTAVTIQAARQVLTMWLPVTVLALTSVFAIITVHVLRKTHSLQN